MSMASHRKTKITEKRLGFNHSLHVQRIECNMNVCDRLHAIDCKIHSHKGLRTENGHMVTPEYLGSKKMA